MNILIKYSTDLNNYVTKIIAISSMAAMLGIKLKKLTTKVEADVNFSKVFGISDAPIME